MITTIRPTLTVSDELFAEALTVIDRSGADHLLETIYELQAGEGGRRSSGIQYTIRSFLVAVLLCVMLKRPPTIAGTLQTISDFTADQLGAVGMGGEDLSAVRTASKSEYAKYHAWLSRRLATIDPDPDLPARRITNGEHRKIVSGRTRACREESENARVRLNDVVNRLVAGSIWTTAPTGCAGDLVADESIFDLVQNMNGLGVADEKYRGATPFARAYGRDRRNKVRATDGQKAAMSKSGIGVGLTAVTRIGEPDRMHSIPPVIVGIDVHQPTSGDPGALLRALAQANANGLTGRKKTERARWPYLTVDMGYNSKRGFADAMIRHGYSYIGRYPKHWTTTYACAPAQDGDRQPGPIMVAGDLYCPAIAKLVPKVAVPSARDLLASSPPGFLDHDRRLQRTLPLLMGRNSRPAHGRMQPGPQSQIKPASEVVKVKVVCPAAFGRVRCPLKPASMALPGDVPTLEPTWTPDTYECCDKTSVTVGLTPDQVRTGQFGMTPGSWEHMLYFEAARALTEQRFSVLKSRTVTGLSHLTVGPRRQPMIAITLALAVSVTNLVTQRAYAERPPRGESIRFRMRQLEADLGYPPTRTPPRT